MYILILYILNVYVCRYHIFLIKALSFFVNFLLLPLQNSSFFPTWHNFQILPLTQIQYFENLAMLIAQLVLARLGERIQRWFSPTSRRSKTLPDASLRRRRVTGSRRLAFGHNSFNWLTSTPQTRPHTLAKLKETRSSRYIRIVSKVETPPPKTSRERRW